MTVLTASALLVSCATPASQAIKATFTGSSECGGAGTSESSATGGADDSLVVTPDPYASDVACQVLLAGGTAADAVAAAQFTLGLTEPQSSGPGGGAVAVYYDAPNDDLTTWNGTVAAPENDDGVSESGEPRTSRLMATLQGRYGNLKLDDVLSPVTELAESGFQVSSRFAGALKRRQDVMTAMPWPGVSAGALPTAGDEITNPDYASYLKGFSGRGGLEPEEALCVDYRGQDVCGSGSTGTGMMVVGEALGILDELELGDDPSHVVTEAERLAFANGNTWMQDPKVDPEQSKAYVDQLVTDPEHLRTQADRISPTDTLGQISPDQLTGESGTYLPNREEGTSQITVRDSDGSMASVTSTLHQHFGTGEVVDGYFLNNSLKNFSASSSRSNQRAAGVRPKTTMTPVIVFRDGSPVMALGSPGGGSIPSFVIKTLVGVIDRGLTSREAIDAPNYGATGRSETYVESDDAGSDSALSMISREGSVYHGEADERAGGAARSTK